MFRPASVPQPLEAVLTDVRSWTAPGAERGVSAEQRAEWISGLQQLRDAVDAAMLAEVAEFDGHADGTVLHGAASTPSWLRGALGITPAEASERVRLARLARDALGHATSHLRTGDITYDHLRAIERSVRHLPADVGAEAVTVLTDLALAGDVITVRTAGRHLQYVTNPDGALRDSERQFERRHLTLSPLLDGMTSVEGLIDAESAALLNAALEPFLVPGGPEDLRTVAQRRADGLVEIVRSACDHRLLPEIASQRPHLQVLWAAAAPSTGEEPPRLNTAPGRLSQAAGATHLHPVAMGRLACDAEISRLLLSPEGVPVQLGRTQRVFSANQRRLLAARDGGCRFPGCYRAPAFTDAHHVHSWLDGGQTDVPNGLLLCRFHHRLVHEGGWRITVTDRGTNADVLFCGPRGQRMPSTPRGP